MELRPLGRSGLLASAFGFGTMTFGGEGRYSRIGEVKTEEAQRLIDICIERDATFLDTADAYSSGQSETMLGKAVAGRRNRVTIATKAFFRTDTGPNDMGNSRRHLIAACEASLRRLGTDWIDLYQVHQFDALTPFEETAAAMDDLVRSGKVRYVGASNYSGWQLMKALAVADARLAARFVSHQINYSLLTRDAENELVPLGLSEGVGTIVWGPLANGLLSGKFSAGNSAPANARAANSRLSPAAKATLDSLIPTIQEIAEAREVPFSQVALNWVAAKAGISCVLVGARNEKQLLENLGASDWKLDPIEILRLDRASRPARPYPYSVQLQFAAERTPYVRALDADR